MKIGIFDDHSIINYGLSEVIKKNFPDFKIVFTCTEREELFSLIDLKHPEILILDVVAPDLAGLELFEIISRDFVAIKIIAHTALTSPILVENLLSLNVSAYVNKRQSSQAIIDAIENVVEGKIYLPEDYQYLLKKPIPIKEGLGLSEREKEIMNLIAGEFTSLEIAGKLNISANTVENHRKNIFNKLKVKNSAGMIMEATRLGYLS